MAVRACQQAVRNLLKFTPRVGSSLLSSRQQLKLSNSLLLQPQRNGSGGGRYLGEEDGQGLEEHTMDVLRLFDKVDPEKVCLEAHFVNDLGLDSLDVVEVIMAFEDEFCVEISDWEAEEIFTVQQGVDLIRAKLDSYADPPH